MRDKTFNFNNKKINKFVVLNQISPNCVVRSNSVQTEMTRTFCRERKSDFRAFRDVKQELFTNIKEQIFPST